MSDIQDNLEQLFQDRFEGYESNVDPSVWDAVQSKLPQAGSAPPDAGMAQTGGKLVLGQFSTTTVVTLTSIAASLLVAFGVYQYLNDSDTPAHQQEELVEQEVAPAQEQNDQDIVPQKEIIVNDNEYPALNTQPEVVQNNPEDFKKPPVHNENNGSDPIRSPEPADSDLAIDEKGTEAPKTEYTTPQENKPDEEFVDNIPEQRPENNEEDPIIENTTPPDIEEIFAGIQFKKIAGQPYAFKFENSGQGSRYEWDMGDGSYAIVDAPAHTFSRPGEYKVRLTVHAQDGRSISDEITLNVFEPSELILPPNALSPNGDHLNDLYNVEGRNMQKVSIKVLNFSGELVFASDSFDKDWDGNDNNGRPLPPGQYPVIIEALGFDGVAHTQKIFVSLYR